MKTPILICKGRLQIRKDSKVGMIFISLKDIGSKLEAGGEYQIGLYPIEDIEEEELQGEELIE